MDLTGILIFLGVLAICQTGAYLLIKAKDIFWFPLIITTIIALMELLYVHFTEDALLITDMEVVGMKVGFASVLLYGILLGMQTITIFELCYEHEDEYGIDDSIMAGVPFIAVIGAVLLTLIGFVVITYPWFWGFLGICAVLVVLLYVFGSYEFDVNIEGVLSLAMLCAVIVAYWLYSMTICQHVLIAAIGLLLAGWIYKKSEYSIFPSYKSTTSSSSSTSAPSAHSARSRSIGERDNDRTVTIKGVYQMNGPKPFTRVIRCSSQSEVSYYTQLMGSKSKQAAWISTNFPGAHTERGFSMSINIK